MGNDDADKLPAEIEKIAAPVIDSLPQERRASVTKVFKQISRFHSGPLPDAETLEHYNRIIPNGADRIMGLVEREAEHRQQQESRVVTCHVQGARRGQLIALSLTLLLGLAGFALGMNGHDWLAATVFTTTIIGVVTVFVIGRSAGERESTDSSQSLARDAVTGQSS